MIMQETIKYISLFLFAIVLAKRIKTYITSKSALKMSSHTLLHAYITCRLFLSVDIHCDFFLIIHDVFLQLYANLISICIMVVTLQEISYTSLSMCVLHVQTDRAVPTPTMRWKSGQEFVRPVYTPLSGPNVRLLEQADRVSNTTPEPGINGNPKIPHKSSVRMLIISTSCHGICTCYRFYLFVIAIVHITFNIICLSLHSISYTISCKSKRFQYLCYAQ